MSKPTPKAPSPTMPVEYTWEALAERFGRPDEKLRAALFAREDPARLVAWGQSVDSANLLKEFPAFAGKCADIYAGLSEAQRKLVLLTPSLFSVLLDEVRVLKKMKAEVDAASATNSAERAERELASRREMKGGITLRDAVYDALKNCLDKERMGRVDRIVGTAEDEGKLATGLQALAGFVRELYREGDDSDRVLLEAFAVTKERADELSAKAAAVEATALPPPVSPRVAQRQLQLHDGRVLALMDRILRAFRAGRRQDATILVPDLRHVAWFFDTRGGKKKVPDGQEQPPAATDAPGKAEEKAK